MYNVTYTKGDVKKPLQDCNTEETLDLRLTLYDKYSKLMGIGKSMSAYQFLMMIKVVDEHLMDLQVEVAKQEAAKAEEAEANVGKIIPSSTDNGKTRYSPSRWTRRTRGDTGDVQEQ